MRKKSAQLFDGDDEVINVDSPQLKVNDEFARRLQVSSTCSWSAPSSLGQLSKAFAKQQKHLSLLRTFKSSSNCYYAAQQAKGGASSSTGETPQGSC